MSLRTSVATWIALESMKRHDVSQAYDPDLDLGYETDLLEQCRKQLKNNSGGEQDAAKRLLTERADRYLRRRMKMNGGITAVAENWRRRVLGIIIATAIMSFILGLFGWFGGRLFVVGAEDKLAVFSAITAVLLPCITLPLAFLGLAKIVIRRFYENPQEGDASLVSRILTHCLDWSKNRFGPTKTNGDPQQDCVWQSASSLLAAQPSLGTLATLTLTNTVLLFLLLGVLAMAQLQIVFHGFDIFWKHNLASNAAAASWLRSFNFPICGFAPMPDEDAIRWANANAETRNEAATRASWELKQHELDPRSKELTADEWDRRWREEVRHSADLAQSYRNQWSRFFLHMAIGYWVGWRLVLMLLVAVTVMLCRHDLEPRLDDPYFRKVVKRIVEPPIIITTEPPIESPDPPQLPPVDGSIPERTNDNPHRPVPVISPSPIDVPETSTAVVSTTTIDLRADTTASPPDQTRRNQPRGYTDPSTKKPDKLWVVGYQTKPPSPLAPELKSLGTTMLEKGEVDGAEAIDEFVKRLHERAQEVKLVVIVAKLDSTPDAAWQDFLSRTAHEATPSKLAVLLTNGQRMYNKWPGNRLRGDNRLRLWRDEPSRVGIEDSRVHEFDFALATPDSQQQLAQTIFAWLSRSGTPTTSRIPGRYPSAFQKVRNNVNELGDAESSEGLQSRTSTLLADILELYRADIQSARTILLKSSDSLRKLGEESRRLVQDGAELGRRLAEDATQEVLNLAVAKVKDWIPNRPSWAVAGALAFGVILGIPFFPAIGLPGIFLSGAAGAGAALAMRRKIVSLTCESVPAGPMDVDPEDRESAFELDDMVRSAVVMIGTLELQALGEARVADSLMTMTDSLSKTRLTRKADAIALIDEAERQLKRLNPAFPR